MEGFSLSNSVDKNKVYIINRSQILGRLDATAYKSSFLFNSKIYTTVNLSEIAFINPTTNFNSLNDDDEITFVPMEAVSDDFGAINKYYTKKVRDTKGFTRFIENDLIWAKITPCMQNGKSAIVKETLNGFACGSTEFFIIRPKSEEVKIEYIHFLLRNEKILQTAQNYFGGSAGQQRVSKDFLLNFKVPLPPIKIQKEIVDKINNAYKLKQQKEAEAKKLLESIDQYLLKELGIVLPQKDYSIEKRIFTTQFSELTGGRFDSYFYQKDFFLFFEGLENGKFPVKSLKSISKKITSGITPLSGGDAYTNIENGIPFIRSGNIDINGNLNFEDLLYLKNEVHNGIMKSSKVEYNDLMIAIVGATIGQVGIYKDKKEANINQAIALVRLKDGINHDYIKEVIKSSIGQYNLNRLKRPVARANINLEEISTMQIIIPSIEKQNEIANHILEIRTKANQLQEEAKAVLESAKQEVEKRILG